MAAFGDGLCYHFLQGQYSRPDLVSPCMVCSSSRMADAGLLMKSRGDNSNEVAFE
jgi:hypothetical protein